jgi:hypothetical protein
MNTDIMDDGFWERLVEGAKTIPKNWNQRCQDSIRKEKAKIIERQNCQFEPKKAGICLRPVVGDVPERINSRETNHLAKSGLRSLSPLPRIRRKRTFKGL